MPGLTLGGLDLLGYDKTGPYWFETLGDDVDWGNPEAVEREIESLLHDGTIVVVDSYGNREMSFPVTICAEDSPGLAAGEKALQAQLRRRNELIWTPPNIITGSGDPNVFDVVHSEPSFGFDDMLEMQALERVYTISIKALPHARSPIQRTFSLTAPPGTTPTVTTIDDGTSTTNWSWSVPGPTQTLTTSGGQVKLDWTNGLGVAISPAVITLTRYGLSVNMATSPYLRIDFSTGGGGRVGGETLMVRLNGVLTAPVATNGSVAWYPFSGTLTSVSFEFSVSVTRYGFLHIYVADISWSNIPQDASGSRQIFGSVDVAGSVRTEATLSIADATPASLGSVLLYTAPNVGTVAQPPLRARLVPGPTETTDSSVVSGKTSPLSTAHAFDVPVTQVPDGTYLLMARVKHASAGTYAIAWDAKSRMGSTDVGATVSGTKSVTLAAGVWTIVALGQMPLPTHTLGTSGMARIDMSGPSGVLLDEAWLFNTDTGELSWLECGTGTPAAGGSASRVWIDPPTLEQPSALVTIGTAADRSDAYLPAVGSLQSWGDHEMVPESMSIFAVTTNAVSMTVSGNYFPRFFSHVIED